MNYNRWSEWWHLDLLKASEEILLEYPRNGCSLNCIPAVGKLPCSCYCWTKLMTWGWSPCRNELKIWNPPLLINHSKTQKPYLKWLTPKNHPPWGITLSSKALRRGWIETTKMQPQTPPKSSNRQGLVPCSISKLKTPARNSIRSSPRMDCVLPLKTTQSLDAQLRKKTQTSILPQNSKETTFPKQALEVPRG